MGKKIYDFKIVTEAATGNLYVSYYAQMPNGTIAAQKKYGRINKTTDLAARERIAAALVLELEKKYKKLKKEIPDAPKIPKPQTSLQSAWLKVLEKYSAHFRPDTFKGFRSKINNFAWWCKKHGIEKVTANNAQDFVNYLLQERKSNNTTVNGYVAVMRWVYKRMPRTPNPFAKVKMLKTDKVPSLYFQTSQIARIKHLFISSGNLQLWQFVQFMYYTFARPHSELRLLKISDFLIDESRIIIRGGTSKNRKTSYVIIPDGLMTTILDMNLHLYDESCYVFGNEGKPGLIPCTKKYFATLHQDLLRSIGIDTIRHKLYSWKHTGVVAFWRKNKDLKQLQLQLRHYSLDMVDKYLKSLGLIDAYDIAHNFPTI